LSNLSPKQIKLSRIAHTFDIPKPKQEKRNNPLQSTLTLTSPPALPLVKLENSPLPQTANSATAGLYI
jgi:hypothetical protein